MPSAVNSAAVIANTSAFTVAEMIREKEGVIVSSSCGRERPRVIDTERDARDVG